MMSVALPSRGDAFHCDVTAQPCRVVRTAEAPRLGGDLSADQARPLVVDERSVLEGVAVAVVESGVFGAREDFQVLPSVVEPVVVDVVDDLIDSERSSECLFHDEPVFRDVATVGQHESVSVRADVGVHPVRLEHGVRVAVGPLAHVVDVAESLGVVGPLAERAGASGLSRTVQFRDGGVAVLLPPGVVQGTELAGSGWFSADPAGGSCAHMQNSTGIQNPGGGAWH